MTQSLFALFLLLSLVACTPEKSSPLPSPTQPTYEQVDYLSGKNGSSEGIQCPVRIVPGRSIGPIELGTPQANLSAVNLKVKQLRASPENFLVGPLIVGTVNGKVHRVEAELAYVSCLEFNGKALAQDLTFEQLQKVFPGCKPTEHRFGGNISECDKVSITQGSPRDAVPAVRISL